MDEKIYVINGEEYVEVTVESETYLLLKHLAEPVMELVNDTIGLKRLNNELMESILRAGRAVKLSDYLKGKV